ncbi:MAG: PHB depolymerase family esterase [Moraxellaceae bacterium]|nr:PHB depolymerase family esterase [Moraxellaceae bacterium]
MPQPANPCPARSDVRPAGHRRAHHRSQLAMLLGVLYPLLCPASVAAQPLPALPQLDTAQITVSGLSSGGAMAMQLAVAYSGRVEGVGLFAAPPYACADGSVWWALNQCMLTGLGPFFGFMYGSISEWGGLPLSAERMADKARRWAGEGKLDPVAKLATQKVWSYRGLADSTVGDNAYAAIRGFYKGFGNTVQEVPDANRRNVPHAIPTASDGLDVCTVDAPGDEKVFLASCRFDGAGAMLKSLLRRGQDTAALKPGTPVAGSFVAFEQKRYLPAAPGGVLSMADTARAYVPARCRDGSGTACKLHVALHGCRQGADANYKLFTERAGYNEWAETLGLVILYPRAIATGGATSANPRGCWDWWGYSGNQPLNSYAWKQAPQMRAVMCMADALKTGAASCPR